MKKIILTGGGTAGHVTPNIALIPRLKEMGYQIEYIGSLNGIEKNLISEIGIPYHGISSGKLRRYFDLKNLSDPFRVIKGFGDALRVLKKEKPNVIFSKGGFVATPVVAAAHLLHIPVIIHESDMTPGLANKLSIPNATRICCNFPETVSMLPKEKTVLTGCPIREELYRGNAENARIFCGFPDKKPVLLIIGGSLGAANVNEAVRKAVPQLLDQFNIIHLCGKGKLDPSFEGRTGYVQYEYIKEELADLFALADVVISRAGANAIYELLSLKKPALLVPLGSAASRGDQILNAESFKKQGYCEVLTDEDITDTDRLIDTVRKIFEDRAQYIAAMTQSPQSNAVEIIVSLIDETASGK